MCVENMNQGFSLNKVTFLTFIVNPPLYSYPVSALCYFEMSYCTLYCKNKK